MKRLAICFALLFSSAAFAKLPPLSDEAKAKAAETKAKSAWSDKVAAYKLCQSQDKAAERYRKENKKPAMDGKAPKCEDPGPFVYTPPVPPSIAPGRTATGTAPVATPEPPPPKK